MTLSFYSILHTPTPKLGYYFLEFDMLTKNRKYVTQEISKWLDNPATGKKIHWITYKKAIKNWGCIPVTIQYQNDTFVSIAKTVAAPDADVKTLIGTKYHGDLEIISYKIGW